MTREELLNIRFIIVFKKMKINVSKEKCKECEAIYRKALKESYYICDGAIEILEILKKNNKKMYTVSNGIAETQHLRLKGSGIDKYFIENFISEEIGSQKPQYEFFDKVYKKIENFDVNKAVIIGDNENADIKGGKNAGLTTVYISQKSSNFADYTIKSIKELKNLI